MANKKLVSVILLLNLLNKRVPQKQVLAAHLVDCLTEQVELSLQIHYSQQQLGRVAKLQIESCQSQSAESRRVGDRSPVF